MIASSSYVGERGETFSNTKQPLAAICTERASILFQTYIASHFTRYVSVSQLLKLDLGSKL